MFLKTAKNLLGRALTALGTHMTDQPIEQRTQMLNEAPPEPKKERPPYNPKEHAAFKTIAPILVQHLLTDNQYKSISDFVRETDERFAQSTVRGVCKVLMQDGYMEIGPSHPAKFRLVPGDENRARCEAFLVTYPVLPNPFPRTSENDPNLS